MALMDKILNPILDRYATKQGYVKQSQQVRRPRRYFSARQLLTGEIVPGEAHNLYASWTDYEFQKLAITNYPVYRNIMLIGKIISQAGFYIEERTPETETGWTKVTDHPYTRVIEQFPNPIMSQSYLWLYQVAWMLLQGEAYWLLADDMLGNLRQVYPLPANRIKPIPNPQADAKRPLLGYAYTPISGQAPELLDPEQVCFDRLPNLFSYFRGMSPISSYLIGLQLNTEAQRTDLEDFLNRLKLQHLISLPTDATDEEFDIAMADLMESEDLALQWKMIRGGDMKVEGIKRDRSDQHLDVFQITERQADSIYGVPDGFWNTESSNRSTADAHKATLIENSVWPLMNMLAEDQTVQIIVPRYGENFRAQFEDIRPVNRELVLQETESARESQTYNEARLAEGGEPHPDSDVGNAPFDSAGTVYELKLQSQLGLLSATTTTTAPVRMPSPFTPPNGNGAARAEAQDLKRYKSVAIRQLRRGKDPGEYQFESGYISEYKAFLLKTYLKSVTTEAQIKAIFSAKNGAFDAADVYIEALRSLIEEAQAGQLTREEFIDQADTVISTELEAAFLKGAEGETIDEEEREEIQDEIDSALAALPQLADDIFAGKFMPEDDDTPPVLVLVSRLALWGSAASGLYAIGRAFRFADELMLWLVGPTDQHCPDCARLNGQVHTGKEWRASGWRPQGRNLDCKGFNCLCVRIPAPEDFEQVGGF